MRKHRQNGPLYEPKNKTLQKNFLDVQALKPSFFYVFRTKKIKATSCRASKHFHY